MAVTKTLLTADGTDDNVSGGSPYTAASISPSSGKLILCAFTGRRNSAADPGDPTVAGNGLTWVLVNSVVYATNNRVGIFRAMGTASAGAPTLIFASNMTNAGWAFVEFDGTDTSGTNGSGAIVQSAVNSTASDTSLTATLAAFAAATHAAFGVFAAGGSPSSSWFGPGSGFEELADLLAGGSGLGVEFKDSEDTTVDGSWSGARPAGAVAVEIKEAAAAGAGGIIHQPNPLHAMMGR